VFAILVPLLVLIEPRPPRLAPSPFTSSFGHWLLVVSVFAGASQLGPTRAARLRLVRANALIGAAVALFALYQAFGHRAGWPGTGALLTSAQREPLRLMPVGELGYVRPTSVFLEPAWLGGYLAFVVAGLLGLLPARGAGHRAARIAVAAALAAVLLAILATVSWGAYLDFAVVLVVGLWGLRRRVRAAPAAAAAVGAALLLALVVVAVSPMGQLVSNAAIERWKTLLETPVGEDVAARDVGDSSWMRAENLRHTVGLIRQHPWRGVGLGQFGRYARTSGPSFIAVAATRDPWCGWLAIAAEAGLAGPAVLAAFLLVVLLRRRARRKEGAGDPEDLLLRVTAPALVLLAAVEQAHTGSYIDLWWWYPLAVALVIASPVAGPAILVSENDERT
jgi:O-antigen ligase